ncbi:MAG: beta-ribofuranosylaminobenzene 5'-phosphate synthase [Methanosarcinaceae archaeon]|nr:beta-ribofuranosylaminobenzene 5'-phosphate synthase [Methanosarcinaceae archaeon]MDD4330888.1 beta-ribofuranosylaminobenzene 5'-phosphate synthase [Methanosarcinaceae archaeon]MDD4748849.1 beta-ribofuranosylaminobenzene 5'-phosphate synthase [Methanosarcinaceae archaeon]
MIRIRSPSRLHLGLIDMNAESGRVDGGLGIALEAPGMEISAQKADCVEVLGDSVFAERMKKAALAVLPKGEGISLQVNVDIPDHVGFGSGTQSALSAAAAVNKLYGLGLSVQELATAVGRGGTSGIGVAAFESGGFIVDGGHKFSEKGSFSPSSASRVPPGPVLFRRDFPDWPILIAVPATAEGAHDQEEVDIFKKFCPVPLAEVQETSHLILMQLLPALLEEDLEAFGKAINRIQALGFKKREVGLQPSLIRKTVQYLRENGAYGAGISSFGPVVFGFVKDQKSGKALGVAVQKMLSESVGGEVFLTCARNKGAEISGGRF